MKPIYRVVNSFGKLICWHHRDRVLGRVLAKCLYTDPSGVPRRIVMENPTNMGGNVEFWTLHTFVFNGEFNDILPMDDDLPLMWQQVEDLNMEIQYIQEQYEHQKHNHWKIAPFKMPIPSFPFRVLLFNVCCPLPNIAFSPTLIKYPESTTNWSLIKITLLDLAKRVWIMAFSSKYSQNSASYGSFGANISSVAQSKVKSRRAKVPISTEYVRRSPRLQGQRAKSALNHDTPKKKSDVQPIPSTFNIVVEGQPSKIPPPICGWHSESCCRSLHFDKFVFQPLQGAYGGLLTIWNSNIVQGSLISCQPFEITAQFTYNASMLDIGLLTNIYGPWVGELRDDFSWLNNIDISLEHNWIFMGDFNS
uniref:Endonuclease/exonuclease/phosphatase domain-containing protein n=1 Tax=Oryza punctata TaxID=4537 RepID=A0A0E0M668_ORYPU